MHTQKIFVIIAVALYTWCPMKVFSEEKEFEITQKNATLDEIVNRLMINAYTYHFNTTSKNLPTGYYIQFEHWQLGVMKQTQKTKLFQLDASAKDSWFFISFPTFPQKHTLVFPSGEDGEFRGDVNFPLTHKDHSSTSNYLKKASLSEMKSNTSMILGYTLIGIEQGLNPEARNNMKVNADDPLSTELALHNKLLIENNRKDVDVIVFRLFFK